MRQNLAQGLATGAAFRLAEATDWGQRVLGRTKKRPRLLPSTPTKGSMFAFKLAGLNPRRDSGSFLDGLGIPVNHPRKICFDGSFCRMWVVKIELLRWISVLHLESLDTLCFGLWKPLTMLKLRGAELVNEAWYPWLSHSWELDSWHSPFFDRDYLVCTLRFSFLK